jgi:hypothetical protein
MTLVKNKMKQITYDGATYDAAGREFHELLTNRNQLVKKRFGENEIVVAAPHHTPKGIDRMPVGRPGDENAGYTARNVADYLKGMMVVAANADYDPNKEPGTYETETFDSNPKIIIETHGHGGTRTKNDIEISCGSSDMSLHSIKLAQRIKHYLIKIADQIKDGNPSLASELKDLKVEGDFKKIYFKAADTRSLAEAREKGITPYHLELITRIRKHERGTSQSLPELGTYVTRAISAAVAEIHGNIIKNPSKTIDDLVRR